jgi:transposase
VKRPKVSRVEIDIDHLKQIIERAPLSDSERKELDSAIETLAYLTFELDNKRTTLRRLRRMLFGARTEKASAVLGLVGNSKPDAESAKAAGSPDPEASKAAADATGAKPKRKGHGRNSAASYRGADTIQVQHPSLNPQDPCPACGKGKLYELKVPAVLVRITGRAPLGAQAFECQRLRCNACGEVFVAEPPAEAGPDKYDETASAMIGMLKYGAGFPFFRLGRLQAGLGIPLPAGTQWQLVEHAAQLLEPAHHELLRQGAQGEVLHNDDTPAKILALIGDRAATHRDDSDPPRTGVFTTGIVARLGALRIALFFTGTRHAGENLAELLQQRARELPKPIQMCDALSRNYAGEMDTILANCLSHSRRKFVDVITSFPDECKIVIEALREVYHNDSIAEGDQMTPAQRLAWHRRKSKPIMRTLHKWATACIKKKRVEDNSGLGEAIAYMLKHWRKLTLFLRVAGAPLDNNVCERILKIAILHRKNALFFKTLNGARVGDIFMSLIHTAELCGADPFDYLVTLLRRHAEVRSSPARWMPWNYRDALALLAA